jgi:hypothetical protein
MFNQTLSNLVPGDDLLVPLPDVAGGGLRPLRPMPTELLGRAAPALKSETTMKRGSSYAPTQTSKRQLKKI